MWVGIFPGLSQTGGVQQVGRHVGAVLVKHARERNLPCELLGLNDARETRTFKVGEQEYGFTGFGRSKISLLFFLFRRMPRIDTLWLGHVNLAPIGLLLRLIRPRLQYCVVAHGVEVWEPLPIFRRWGLRHAQQVMSVSAYTANAMVKAQRLDPQKVFVLSPALEPGFTQDSCDRASLPFPPHGRMLLTVGRLIASEPGKGVESVIKALPEVIKAVPDVFYVVVGGGDLQPRLEELARENLVGDRVIFVGALQLQQLKSYYSRADVFVMPSRQEGFGIVLLEAMAFGKPVIAGDHGGGPEIVQEGVTGFSVDPDVLKTLTGRLIQLLQDEALRMKMGAAGRQRVEEKFTFARFERELTEILDRPSEPDSVVARK
jgi:phosphatidyl-myo-inositol dimannoside synthase